MNEKVKLGLATKLVSQTESDLNEAIASNLNPKKEYLRVLAALRSIENKKPSDKARAAERNVDDCEQLSLDFPFSNFQTLNALLAVKTSS